MLTSHAQQERFRVPDANIKSDKFNFAEYLERVPNFWQVISVEPVSKMPEQDEHTGEQYEPLEVVGVPTVSGANTAEVLKPGEEPLHLPAPLVAA